VAYCVEADLLLEGLPVNTVVDTQKYIDSAADEIDIILGDTYITPIEVVDIPENRRTKLFLQQCNAQIASGRIIIAVTLTREADNLHAAARQMINMALAALNQIVSGQGVLPGATINPAADMYFVQILASNTDPTSRVDDFYKVASPNGFTAKPTRWGLWPRMPGG